MLNKKIFIGLVLLILMSKALAHDPGISQLKACMNNQTLKLDWTLSTQEFQRLQQNNQLQSLITTNQNQALSFDVQVDKDDARLSWAFRSDKPNPLIHVHAFKQLALGHQIYATSCITTQPSTALLDALNQQWQLNVPVGSFIQKATQHTGHGLIHILKGYDHLLFVLCICLGIRSWRQAVVSISLFSVGHTITLSGVALSGYALPSLIVEPAIATSIIVTGLFLLIRPQLKVERLALLVGLIHGLGFGEAALSLVQSLSGFDTTLGIASFTLGIEIGQLLVAAPGILLIRAISASGFQTPVIRYGASLSIILGTVWLIQIFV